MEITGQQHRDTHWKDGSHSHTKKELFSLLPGPTQKSILLHASEAATDVLSKCHIWLITVRIFPDTAPTLGLDLYDLLSQQPSLPLTLPENPCRELLVQDVIPLLAESREVKIEQPLLRSKGQTVVLKTSHLCQWLESAASYYTITTARTLRQSSVAQEQGKANWERLHRLFMLIADKCVWRDILHNKQIGPHLPAKVRWHGLEKLSGYSSHAQPFEAPRNVAIACFYIAVFLFFEMAWDYCSGLLCSMPGEASADHVPLVLIEDSYTNQPVDEKPSKRRKLEGMHYQAVLDIQTGSRQQDQKMVESFKVALDCWDFLQSNITYRGEFSRLCQQWGAFEWAWLSSFRTDMAIYKGDHALAMQILQHEWHKIKEEDKSNVASLRFILQMVNCSVMLGNVKGSCGFASEVISLFPYPVASKKPAAPSSQHHTSTAARHLRLLRCAADEILPYCIEVIIRTLKDVALSDPKNERALGDLLVLVQYQWPKEEAVFANLITTIQKRRKFSFPEFFKYIITIDILEEMLYLYNSESLQINLLPPSANKSRTVTRGVNRGAKEDFTTAMEAQLKRCGEPIEPLLRKFFKQEKLSLPVDS